MSVNNGDTEDHVSPIRETHSNAIPAEDATWYIEGSMVHDEGGGTDETEADVRISRSRGLVYLLLSAEDTARDVDVQESVRLTPENAREVAVTLWTCAEYVEELEAEQ